MGHIAKQLRAIAEAMATEHQKAAIETTVNTFKALDPALVWAVVEEFATDFKAKAFLPSLSALQKRWVKTVIQRCSGELLGRTLLVQV